MNIFKKAAVTPTGIVQPYRWEPVKVETQVTELCHGEGFYGNQTEYRLSVRLGCTFCANQVQYNDAIKIAKEAIIRELYRDSLRWISHARKAVMECDARNAMYALDELEKRSLGETKARRSRLKEVGVKTKENIMVMPFQEKSLIMHRCKCWKLSDEVSPMDTIPMYSTEQKAEEAGWRRYAGSWYCPCCAQALIYHLNP